MSSSAPVDSRKWFVRTNGADPAATIALTFMGPPFPFRITSSAAPSDGATTSPDAEPTQIPVMGMTVCEGDVCRSPFTLTIEAIGLAEGTSVQLRYRLSVQATFASCSNDDTTFLEVVPAT